MAAQSTEAHVVRFGVFELDLRAGELRKAGNRLNLPEQPFQVLISLLERPGELVMRDELRQRLWQADTFVDFEHGLNAAVKRLRDVLGDSADTPRFIETVPRRGYRFIAPLDTGIAATHDSAPRSHRRVWWLVASVSVFVVVLALMAAWRFRPATAAVDRPMRVMPLTALKGTAYRPTFSPDGQQVAFQWDGENNDNNDIYVTVIGSSQVRRLTDDPADDGVPSWSPDGRQIAFLRASKKSDLPYHIHVMSALGGPDLRVSDLPVSGQVSWSPDGQHLAVARLPSWLPRTSDVTGLYLVPARGGEARALTHAVAPVTHRAPAFSPDGRRLAFASCDGLLSCQIEVLELDAAYAPVSPPRPLTKSLITRDVAWTRDGASVIYDSEVAAGTLFLFRVGINGAGPPERIEVAGLGAREPATVPSLDRLAFAREHWDTDIYGFDYGRSSRRVIGSSYLDIQPAYSPDGRRIAFCSSRSGEGVEVWVAASDGSLAQQLTRGPGRWQGSPHWSPDSRRIAFDSDANGGHIWTIDADGGTAKQLTNGAGRQYVPRWSRDGQWIYYTWQNGHAPDIWRTRPSGGPPERVTNGGAAFGLESADGQSLVYQKGDADGPLLAMPLSGGPAREVVKCVRGNGGFFPGSQGIYYVACNPGLDVVYVRHPETGRDELLGRLENAASGAIPYFGLAVSPDGKRILYSKTVTDGSDLMLIENFR